MSVEIRMREFDEAQPRRMERAYPLRVLHRAKRNRWWPLIAPGRPWHTLIAPE